MTEAPWLVVITSVVLIIGAFIAIPLMNRRRYGPPRSTEKNNRPSTRQ